MTSGHDGTPPQGKDFGDFLRRSLHAAADHIEPSVEGLERIRARVRSGPAHASRATSGSASSGFLADAVRRWNALRGGHGSTPGHRARRARDWREALIRPAIALACAVFAAGAVLASVPQMRQALTSSVSAALDGQKATSASSSAAGGGKALTGGAGSVTTPAASQPALIVVHGRELANVPEPARRQIRRLQRLYVEEWVGVLAELMPGVPAVRLRTAAHAAIGLLNSTPYTLGGPGVAELGPEIMADMLVGMARAALMAAGGPGVAGQPSAVGEPGVAGQPGVAGKSGVTRK